MTVKPGALAAHLEKTAALEKKALEPWQLLPVNWFSGGQGGQPPAPAGNVASELAASQQRTRALQQPRLVSRPRPSVQPLQPGLPPPESMSIPGGQTTQQEFAQRAQQARDQAQRAARARQVQEQAFGGARAGSGADINSRASIPRGGGGPSVGASAPAVAGTAPASGAGKVAPGAVSQAAKKGPGALGGMKAVPKAMRPLATSLTRGLRAAGPWGTLAGGLMGGYLMNDIFGD